MGTPEKMAKPKSLTSLAISNLKPRPKDEPKRYEISDPGCAGLRVVVFPSGQKSYIVRYRFRGVQRKLTLGRCLGQENGEGEPTEAPELATPLSLAAARELATKALRQARSGSDPAAAKAKKRQEQRAAESDTLGAIAQEYLRRKEPQRADNQLRSDLDLLCVTLGRLPVSEITRGQYTRVLDHIADERGPVRSDRTRTSLNRLLNWHASRCDYVNVLGRGGRRTRIAERARTRVLNDDELRAVWVAAEQDTTPFGGYVRFLLLTGTRRNEAGGLHRSELSDGGRTWIIPGSRYKNGRDTLIPLSEAAQKIVASIPQLAGDYVFGATGEHQLNDHTTRKRALDTATAVTGWVLHDLRRTARTLLSRAGISADIAEMCLGHALVGVRGTYDRHRYEAEKRQAFEALAALIEQIVSPKENVVLLAEGRSKTSSVS
jgi:integrase